MILYHFTKPEYVDAIMRDGLMPADGSASGAAHMLGGRQAVWLISEPTLTPTRRYKEIRLLHGEWWRTKSTCLPMSTVCLQVRIPSRDTKLKEFLPWVRKHPIQGFNYEGHVKELMRNWWVYFGTVRPECLTVFKRIPEGEPYWTLPNIEEAYRAGVTIKISDEMIVYYLDGQAEADQAAAEFDKLEK